MGTILIGEPTNLGLGLAAKGCLWLRLRASVLREAGYRCQYAKRYGKRVQATTVHHIWPAEDFPEYALERWNLIALSTEAHNRMHDRATGRLTEEGERLRRRDIPPSSRSRVDH